MCPYDDLFIYYIQGCLKPEWEEGLGQAFLGNWEEDGYSFLFFTESSHELVFRLVSGHEGLTLLDNYIMPYDQWQQDHDAVFDIGSFSVCAPWAEHTAPKDKTRLWLDPGVVFGTGNHPTTSDCMGALEMLYAHTRPAKVLDLGTGTGLLALAAVALGAQSVVAVDLNPLAAKTAARNVVLNDMEDKIRVIRGSALDYADETAQLVVANIHFEVMKSLVLIPGFVDNKHFILSGLLRSEIRDIKYRLKQCGAHVSHEWEQENTWFTLLGEGPGA